MANKRISELDKIQSMQETDSIVVIVDNKEYLITKENFSKVLSLLSTEQKNKISAVVLSGDGNKFLTDSGVYKSIDKIFKHGQVSQDSTTKLFEISGYHNHSNQSEVLDKLSVSNGELYFDGNTLNNYTLPPATNTTLGGIKVDGTTISISEDGIINYELPTASATVLGGVKIDGDTIKINDGIISADVIGNWSAGVNYPVGYFVVHDDKLYQCNTANSDNEWTESKWNPIAGGGNNTANITEWTCENAYTVGDLVIHENTIYKCIEAHTSATSFDLTKWTSLTGAKGDKGDTGADGQNGISPTIDPETKHWIIGEVDTGVLAEAQITSEIEENFVTKTEFNDLKNIITSANALLENTLNGGE